MRGDSPQMVFERTGSTWSQREPFEHPMEAFAIRQLAMLAREAQVADVIAPAKLTEGLSLAGLAIDPPAAQIAYEWPGGSLTLRLGRRSFAGRAYAQIAGDDSVYIINQKLHERIFDMDPKEWRDRTLFANATSEPSRIEWRNGPVNMALERQGKQWTMVKPAKTRLDKTAIDQLLNAIGQATVAGFLLDQPDVPDLAKFGVVGSPVSLSVTWPGSASPESQGGRTERLIVGARAGGATHDFFGFVESRPVVVKITGAVLAALFKRPQDVVAQTGSGINPADVKSIIIRKGAEELKLERDLEKWRSVTPVEREINAAHVQQLLEQLTQLRALSAEIQDYPRELEVATITLHGYDGKAIDTVRIVQEKETNRWGMENGDNVIRIHPAGLQLRLTAADFGVQ